MWSYYFLNIIEERPEEAKKILMELVNQFSKLIQDEENIIIKGNNYEKLVLDNTFCRIWFGTSLNLMLIYQYGKHGYKKAFECIKKEFLSHKSEIKTLVIA